MPENRASNRDLLKAPLPQRLLRNNERISDEEYQLVLIAVSRVQDEITRLKELDDAEGQSQATYRRLQACEEFVRKHQTLLHWTRRSPSELLIDIFVWCTDDNTVIPWNVSRVCRRWRTIALGTPQLWRKIPFAQRYRDIATERRLFAFLSSDYLRRSRTETLIFTWRPWYKLAERFYALLLQNVDRWGDVHLVIDERHDDRIRRRLANLQGRLLSLYALKLTIEGESWDVSLEMCSSAPQLKFLQVKDRRLLTWFSSPTVWPSNQVTHLSASIRDMRCWNHHPLASLAHLVYLRFRWSQWSEMQPSQIIFQACRFLHLELYLPARTLQVENTPNLLRLMHFPILESLFIYHLPFDAERWIIKELGNFMQRHATDHLRSFHWHHEVNYHSIALSYNRILVERALFDHLKGLLLLRLTLPSRDLLRHILTSLRANEDFMPSLERLDIKLDAVFFKGHEVEWITEALRDIVGTPGCKIDEIRIQIPPSSTIISILPWELVLKLDGWDDILRADVEERTTIEGQLEALSLESRSGTRSPAIPMAEVGGIPIQVAKLRRTLTNFKHGRVSRTPTGPVREDVLRRWIMMFFDRAKNRRWTTAGDDSVVYISPHSPLRKQDSRWVLGVSDYEALHVMDYLDHDRVPMINPSWLVSEDIARDL